MQVTGLKGNPEFNGTMAKITKKLFVSSSKKLELELLPNSRDISKNVRIGYRHVRPIGNAILAFEALLNHSSSSSASSSRVRSSSSADWWYALDRYLQLPLHSEIKEKKVNDWPVIGP